MNANINRYEIFLKVVELGNITKTAEVLNYTQSGVSHAIAALEKETGFPLFVRKSSGVALTDDGRRILEPIQNLVNQQRNLAQTIFRINNVVAGTIRVGTFTSVSAHWVPDIILSFREKYPLVEFELLTGDYGDIIAWILQGRIDCGFLTAPVAAPLVFRPLKKDPMLVLLHPDHPLASKETLTLEEVIQEPFVVPMEGCDKDIQAVLCGCKGPLKVKYALNDDLSVLSMVAHGFGVGIMPELILRKTTFALSVKPLDPPQYRTIGIASLPVGNTSVIAKTFLKYLAETDCFDVL
ncbi:LysR family transcriptional regulator [Bacilliculturomica massiliensis]|uniref:LysR family transcriptional regulator n=1 Tax=Bacilliculturomica massiliensis TaxID=1917867 RepID=UPI00103141A6|nr:LysR family transcriptional regulator [Bacilliculturomica massiliensis]